MKTPPYLERLISGRSWLMAQAAGMAGERSKSLYRLIHTQKRACCTGMAG